MYKVRDSQMTVYDYIPPMEGQLNPENRWLRLADAIDWLALEGEYSSHFATNGKCALPVRVAFGSLVIARALHISDRETVALVKENPYMQVFLGLSGRETQVPLSIRSMNRFRHRFAAETVEQAAALLRTFR